MSAVECFVKDDVTPTLQHCTMTFISHMYLSNGDQQSQGRHMCLYVLFMWQSLGRTDMCIYLSNGDQQSQGRRMCLYVLFMWQSLGRTHIYMCLSSGDQDSQEMCMCLYILFM